MNVLSVGGATIDTIVSIDDADIERMSLHNADASYLLLAVGRKCEAEAISVQCGGGAANAAVAMARLGHETSVLIKLGRDFRADLVLARLSAEGVSARFVVHDNDVPTGASVLASAHDNNTAVITFRGANTRLTPADLDPRAFAVDLVYVASLSDGSADCFPDIVAAARSAGALVAANPGIRQLSTRQEAFRASLSSIDILSLNRHEAMSLVPWLPTIDSVSGPETQELADDDMALARVISTLQELGPRWVVVTDAEHGAYVGTRTGIFHCSALPVDIAGTAGAGDAFNATFAVSILTGDSVEQATIAATINSASVVTHLDTQSGLLGAAELATRVVAERDRLCFRHWPNGAKP